MINKEYPIIPRQTRQDAEDTLNKITLLIQDSTLAYWMQDIRLDDTPQDNSKLKILFEATDEVCFIDKWLRSRASEENIQMDPTGRLILAYMITKGSWERTQIKAMQAEQQEGKDPIKHDKLFRQAVNRRIVSEGTTWARTLLDKTALRHHITYQCGPGIEHTWKEYKLADQEKRTKIEKRVRYSPLRNERLAEKINTPFKNPASANKEDKVNAKP